MGRIQSPCPMPHAQCPMPNAQCPMNINYEVTYGTNYCSSFIPWRHWQIKLDC
ncbi:hypothetical protein [Nostoc favosum]|uniref:Uncharacterized protein n=1 Tax=Nostoc favosum CHAB5714 TaxID=2780399 RepID=A0ABS8IBJ2_9NOSO|nr:hypothetical protein [Nostoc favosum]MCC5601580.1 hypothetical protein [Nostoc favosum CHAB5714]